MNLEPIKKAVEAAQQTEKRNEERQAISRAACLAEMEALEEIDRTLADHTRSIQELRNREARENSGPEDHARLNLHAERLQKLEEAVRMRVTVETGETFHDRLAKLEAGDATHGAMILDMNRRLADLKAAAERGQPAAETAIPEAKLNAVMDRLLRLERAQEAAETTAERLDALEGIHIEENFEGINQAFRKHWARLDELQNAVRALGQIRNAPEDNRQELALRLSELEEKNSNGHAALENQTRRLGEALEERLGHACQVIDNNAEFVRQVERNAGTRIVNLEAATEDLRRTAGGLSVRLGILDGDIEERVRQALENRDANDLRTIYPNGKPAAGDAVPWTPAEPMADSPVPEILRVIDKMEQDGKPETTPAELARLAAAKAQPEHA